MADRIELSELETYLYHSADILRTVNDTLILDHSDTEKVYH